MKVEVLRFVSNLMHAGESRTDGEVDVTEKGVLCGMKANGDGTGVAGADLEVDVADGGVKGAWIGVRHVVSGRYDSPRCRGRMVKGSRRACACWAGTRAGEEEHISYAVLVARGVFAEHKDGPLGAIANETHARPEVDRAADTVAALGNEDDAFAFCGLQLVDGCLNGCAVIFLAVAVGVKLLRSEIDRRRVVKARGIGRRGRAGRCYKKSYEQRLKDLHWLFLLISPTSLSARLAISFAQSDTTLRYIGVFL